MKVGLVTPFFLPEIGGANIYCFELARALSGLGHEVHLFAKPGALEDPAYRLHPVLTGNLATDIDALRDIDMDVWHALFFFYAPLALHKDKVVVTGHGDDCFSYRFRYPLRGRAWLERNLLWRLPEGVRGALNELLSGRERRYNDRIFARAAQRARIITVSSFTRDKLAERFPGIRDRITVIPPGVSERFFANRGGTKERRRLLTVSRIDETDRIKNIHGVIAALGMLKDEYDFDYTIVGGATHGNYREELEGMIAERGLSERVRILGRQSDEALLKLYADSGLFVLVSYAQPGNFEGFGIVFLEANASGVPVLTSRQGGMADYVVEGVNGFYVNDPSAEGIRDALKKYFDGGVAFDESTVRAAPGAYSWSGIAERIAAVYENSKTHSKTRP